MTGLDTQHEIELEKAIDEAMKEYIRYLVASAFVAYADGELDAYESLGMRVDMKLVDQYASQYSEEYQKMLTEEGATIMNGQKVYWLKDMDVEMRRDIGLIIDQGISEGKYPGVRERRTGGYADDTIGKDLNKYFDQRRSQATTVARTEVKRIQNDGALDRFKDFGFDLVWVHDGEGQNPCEICQAVNGEVWTLEYARSHELEHPNCTRTFSAYKGDRAPDRV